LFVARDAGIGAAELMAGTQSNFGNHQEVIATRYDVKLAGASAEVAHENDEAMLLKVLCGTFLGQLPQLFARAPHTSRVRLRTAISQGGNATRWCEYSHPAKQLRGDPTRDRADAPKRT